MPVILCETLSLLRLTISDTLGRGRQNRWSELGHDFLGPLLGRAWTQPSIIAIRPGQGLDTSLDTVGRASLDTHHLLRGVQGVQAWASRAVEIGVSKQERLKERN